GTAALLPPSHNTPRRPLAVRTGRHFVLAPRPPSLLPSPLFFLMLPPPPRSTLFPYTTLFRSRLHLEAPPPRLTTLAAVSPRVEADRKSTRLNSSHVKISYAVFCLKKKTGPF